MFQQWLKNYYEWQKKHNVGTMFVVSGIVYLVLIDIVVMLTVATLTSGVFFSIVNKSNYDQLATKYARVDLNLHGYCVYAVNGASNCVNAPFGSMFYVVPNTNALSKNLTIFDLPTALETVSTENPYTFVPMLISGVMLLFCNGYAYHVFKVPARRNIRMVVYWTLATLVVFIANLVVAIHIYSGVLEASLNTYTVVTVTQGGQVIKLSGYPTSLGVSFSLGSGEYMLIGSIALLVFAMLFGGRWIFEGNQAAVSIRGAGGNNGGMGQRARVNGRLT